MAEMLSEEEGISISEAIKAVYASNTYRQLEQENTKFWHLAPVALFESLKSHNTDFFF